MLIGISGGTFGTRLFLLLTYLFMQVIVGLDAGNWVSNGEYSMNASADTRPWKNEESRMTDDGSGGQLLGTRPIRAAHADKSGKADPRWPLGSALNPIQPGES